MRPDPFGNLTKKAQAYEKFVMLHDIASAVTIDIAVGFETSKSSTHYRWNLPKVCQCKIN